MNKRLLRSTGIVLAIFLLSLKLGDLAIGHVLFGSSSPLAWYQEGSKRFIMLREHPPNINVTIHPDATYLSSETDGLEGKDVRLRTDADGFILGPETESGPIDIIFIGGSTTECLYLDEDKRFPYLVSRLLAREDGWRTVRTVNAGVSGNLSIHTLANLIAKGIKHRPKIVVLMENINDFVLLSNTGSFWDAPASKRIVQDPTGIDKPRFSVRAQARGIKDVLLPNTWLLLRSLLPAVLFPPAIDEYAGFRLKNQRSTEQIASDFRAMLTSNIAVLKSWGIYPVLMTQFNRVSLKDAFIKGRFAYLGAPIPRISYENFVDNYNLFNNVIRSTAIATNVPLIDLDADIPKTKEFIYDAVHLNNRGSTLAATIISKAIARDFEVDTAGLLSKRD